MKTKFKCGTPYYENIGLTKEDGLRAMKKYKCGGNYAGPKCHYCQKCIVLEEQDKKEFNKFKYSCQALAIKKYRCKKKIENYIKKAINELKKYEWDEFNLGDWTLYKSSDFTKDE